MQIKLPIAFLTVFFIFTFSSIASEYELKTTYVTISYSSADSLRKFNKTISLGSLSYLLKNRHGITSEDELKNKIDVLIERVESVLEMFPSHVKLTIALLPSENEVQGLYRSKYGKNVDFIAFYSPRDQTIFVSVKDVDLGVLAHEIAHAVIDFYYGMATPSKIHEVLAQYVESHLKD